jgi:enoyl-CoA hydratase/carnithine racemase
MTDRGRVRVEVHSGVAQVTLSQPAKRNAITVEMWQQLRECFGHLAQLTELLCIVVRGEDGHFASGADITEFPRFRFNEATLRAYHEEVIAPALDAIWNCDVPIVAMIEGNCIGGGLEVASCCDVRLASADASFGAPVAKLGFPMAPLEFAALARVFGVSTVRELLLVPKLLNAQQALARGLVSSVHASAYLATVVDDTVKTICRTPHFISRSNKNTARCIAENRLSEVQHDHFCYASEAWHRAGVEAFLNKSINPSSNNDR